jgi:hypothetical protein
LNIYFFITRNQKTVTNRWSDQKLSSDWLIQPNTDNLQQAEDYVRDCTWQLERIKFIYRFQQSSHISYERKWFLSLLSLTRRDNEIKWFLSLLSLTRRDNEITWFLSLLSLTRRDNERKDSCLCWVLQEGIMRDKECKLSQWWLKSVVFSNLHFLMLFYTSSQVEHLYTCLQDCSSSSVVTCH